MRSPVFARAGEALDELFRYLQTAFPGCELLVRSNEDGVVTRFPGDDLVVMGTAPIAFVHLMGPRYGEEEGHSIKAYADTTAEALYSVVVRACDREGWSPDGGDEG